MTEDNNGDETYHVRSMLESRERFHYPACVTDELPPGWTREGEYHWTGPQHEVFVSTGGEGWTVVGQTRGQVRDETLASKWVPPTDDMMDTPGLDEYERKAYKMMWEISIKLE